MRTIQILSITAIAIASLGVTLYTLQDTPVSQSMDTKEPTLRTTATHKVPTLPLRDTSPAQSATSAQQQLSLISERIASLESRLRDMEATAREREQNHVASVPNEPDPGEDTEKVKAKKISEGDFSQWMDRTLTAGDFDRDTTTSVTEQMATSVAEAPGVNLADIQCGARFCRASFVSDDGKTPNVAPVIGASSFIESGFTITEPDGRVKVYFTQPGESLSDLRSEAQEDILGETSLN